MYEIAIPSYNRSDQLVNKTLYLLDKENINFSLITVFVANEEEYKIYRQALNLLKKGKKIKIVIGKKGIVEINNFINCHYKPTDIVFYIHDDIDDFIYYDRCLADILKKCTNYLKKSPYGLLSFNPTGNKFYMNERNVFKEGFYYAVGPMFMFKPNSKIKRSKNSWAVEDYDYSIKSYKFYGKTIRYDRLGLKTKINNNKKGGCGIRDNKTYEKSLMNLYKKNMDYITLTLKSNKKNCRTFGVFTIKHPRLFDKANRKKKK